MLGEDTHAMLYMISPTPCEEVDRPSAEVLDGAGYGKHSWNPSRWQSGHKRRGVQVSASARQCPAAGDLPGL